MLRNCSSSRKGRKSCQCLKSCGTKASTSCTASFGSPSMLRLALCSLVNVTFVSRCFLYKSCFCLYYYIIPVVIAYLYYIVCTHFCSEYLRAPTEFVLHEVYYYDDLASLRRAMNVSPRATIHSALSNPHKYIKVSFFTATANLSAGRLVCKCHSSVNNKIFKSLANN